MHFWALCFLLLTNIAFAEVGKISKILAGSDAYIMRGSEKKVLAADFNLEVGDEVVFPAAGVGVAAMHEEQGRALAWAFGGVVVDLERVGGHGGASDGGRIEGSGLGSAPAVEFRADLGRQGVEGEAGAPGASAEVAQIIDQAPRATEVAPCDGRAQ